MQIILTINADYEALEGTEPLSSAAVTDALNETLHQIALDYDLTSDLETGGYVGFDWEYDPVTVRRALSGLELQ